ncbi:hypothetical protein O1611_g10308 [Lasiodiplodia mahajangana]|uniref:Uncharacterized protein n=1 Tax=Lasiodiplodia mahajangana TaxID=1108764 RepID=A0ACC2IZW2_9PEZI|nr:hypothetical protein O1611_g10308 [Lasiodiplodia mahajangana]
MQASLIKVLTPPSTPELHMRKSTETEAKPPAKASIRDTFLLPPTPPVSPISPITPSSLRSIRSASTLIASPTLSLYSPTFRPSTSSQNEKALPPSPFSLSRPISLIFSPHGVRYNSISHYATSHLVAEAALPLTALLHCMDSISNPWWLGGNICAGVPYGAEIASKLGARLWISAHDGEKDVRGLATGLLKTHRWKDEEIENALQSGLGGAGNSQITGQDTDREKTKSARKSTAELLRLKCGEEILVSGTGQLWRTAEGDAQSNVNLAKETIAPAQPTIQSAPARTKHKSKHGKKGLEIPILPKVQDAMSPKKLGIYKALRTIDLINPSPKLVLEQHVTGNLASTPPEPKSSLVQSLPEIKTEKVADSIKVDSTVPKSDLNGAQPATVEIST